MENEKKNGMENENKNLSETEKKSGKGKWLAAVIGLVLLVALFVVVYVAFAPKTQEGSKAVTVTVVDKEGMETVYECHTDAEYLMELVEETDGLELTGYESEYGFFIEGVNGLTAIYETDGAYWALYVNGEYGMYGVDSQPVVDGDTYSFVYEYAVTE